MKAPGTAATSFISAVGAIGVASFLTRACPGGCTSCTTCAATLMPMGTSAVAVGIALAGSARVRSHASAHAAPDAPEPDPDAADASGPTERA